MIKKNITVYHKKSRRFYDILLKVGGAVVMSTVILTSIMLKIEPVKQALSVSSHFYTAPSVIIDAGHGGSGQYHKKGMHFYAYLFP